tara:strand:+ start:401 stop:1003 length:603 start_codon:yes stop_codon:yes gene_type:complete
MTKKIFISDNKDIGLKCKSWALNNLPDGFTIVDDMAECEIFLSVQYDKILSKSFLNKRRCYNFHPNILPSYGGVGTLTFSILNKEEFAGVTLHVIDDGVDTGDIIKIDKIKIEENETAFSLHLKTFETMYNMFKKMFFNLLTENFKIKKQSDVNRKVYTYKQLDKLFDLSNFMRATYYPNRPTPFFYNKDGKKINLHYEE